MRLAVHLHRLMHAADAHQARTGGRPRPSPDRPRLIPALGFFAIALRKDGLRTKHVQQVVEIADGDVVPLPGAPVIIGRPGHSPGSIAIHVPVADAVVVGDAFITRNLLTGAEVHRPQPAPFSQSFKGSRCFSSPAQPTRRLLETARARCAFPAPCRSTPRCSG